MTTTTFLTLVGDQCEKAEEAVRFYISIFPNSQIKDLTKYAAKEGGGAPALIKHGVFTLNGTEYMMQRATTIMPGPLVRPSRSWSAMVREKDLRKVI